MNEPLSHAATLTELSNLPIIRGALVRLDQELPHALCYHSAQHTRDVLSEALRFALADGRGPRELLLIAIAAAYHDLGYLERYEKNEPVGADLAEAVMRAEGDYSDDEIVEVRNIILSTQVSQQVSGLRRTQRTALAAYVMDADWGSFGRDDFFEKCDQLIEETGASADAFYERTLQLVTGHRWLTPAAHGLREEKKQRNLQELRQRLSEPVGLET